MLTKEVIKNNIMKDNDKLLFIIIYNNLTSVHFIVTRDFYHIAGIQNNIF